MKNQRVQAEIIRKPDSVFVSVQPPDTLQKTMAASAQHRVWATVAQTIAVEERAMNRTTTSQECTPTPEPTPVSDPQEIRIYAEDCLSGKRTLLYTGVRHEDTDALCQVYVNLAECRVDWHTAKYSKLFFPNTLPIPTLNDWVEVHNADTGDLIWVGLRDADFDNRCRTYADRTGTGLRVDFTNENRSQFYTPRSEQLRYGRENAKHFAKKYGVPVADAVGMLAITAVAWAAYVVMGVC